MVRYFSRQCFDFWMLNLYCKKFPYTCCKEISLNVIFRLCFQTREEAAIRDLLTLTKDTRIGAPAEGAHLHIVHLSDSSNSLDLIKVVYYKYVCGCCGSCDSYSTNGHSLVTFYWFSSICTHNFTRVLLSTESKLLVFMNKQCNWVSTLLQDAKSGGDSVTVETCPHYLAFSAEEIRDGDTRFKCSPPIRDAANKEKLWEALLVYNHSMFSYVYDRIAIHHQIGSIWFQCFVSGRTCWHAKLWSFTNSAGT